MKRVAGWAIVVAVLALLPPAALSKWLSNPFHRHAQDAAGSPLPTPTAFDAQDPKAPGKKPKMLDATSMYTNALWGPNSPLLNEKNPIAMRRYRQAMRKAHHKHFWQKGV